MHEPPFEILSMAQCKRLSKLSQQPSKHDLSRDQVWKSRQSIWPFFFPQPMAIFKLVHAKVVGIHATLGLGLGLLVAQVCIPDVLKCMDSGWVPGYFVMMLIDVAISLFSSLFHLPLLQVLYLHDYWSASHLATIWCNILVTVKTVAS